MRTDPPKIEFDESGFITNGVWKFVKVNGEYRWIENLVFDEGHASLVDKGETAESAGLIFIFKDFWRMEDSYSSTLKVGCKGDEREEISALLGLPHRDKYS